ncbi:hypothetical protein NPIL_120971 [Nephila pilipes]|uniref:Uncharacterized protein n=1 Tax=Nephila pilipes TaxID=299642 RepID=A0A8X6NTB1_NEPPI|nr:hypothetical protein NPIL_120971 [Nephila pilipes]
MPVCKEIASVSKIFICFPADSLIIRPLIISNLKSLLLTTGISGFMDIFSLAIYVQYPDTIGNMILQSRQRSSRHQQCNRSSTNSLRGMWFCSLQSSKVMDLLLHLCTVRMLKLEKA